MRGGSVAGSVRRSLSDCALEGVAQGEEPALRGGRTESDIWSSRPALHFPRFLRRSKTPTVGDFQFCSALIDGTAGCPGARISAERHVPLLGGRPLPCRLLRKQACLAWRGSDSAETSPTSAFSFFGCPTVWDGFRSGAVPLIDVEL